MKAFLLAAGYGTRLKPITDTIPKCMVPICGKPLIEWWIALFGKYGVSEVLVNTHYLAEQVRDFIKRNNTLTHNVHITEFFEPELLGSGGTVAANRSFIGEDESFLICYADNLTDINLGQVLRFHQAHNGVLTMALFRADNPQQCGIAKLDGSSRVIAFEEKPTCPESNLANAGIYVCRRDIFNLLPSGRFLDFGKDVLPELTGRMYGYEMHDYLIDIGTIPNLEKAEKEWTHDYI